MQVAAYTYRADIICPECTLETLLGERNIEGHGLSHVPSEAIDRLGVSEFGGEKYSDERNWDSDDFPKVVFSSQIEDDEYCGICHREI